MINLMKKSQKYITVIIIALFILVVFFLLPGLFKKPTYKGYRGKEGPGKYSGSTRPKVDFVSIPERRPLELEKKVMEFLGIE